jgi:hypothetical protein
VFAQPVGNHFSQRIRFTAQGVRIVIRFKQGFFLLLVAFTLAGCAVNPVTGRNELALMDIPVALYQDSCCPWTAMPGRRLACPFLSLALPGYPSMPVHCAR